MTKETKLSSINKFQFELEDDEERIRRLRLEYGQDGERHTQTTVQELFLEAMRPYAELTDQELVENYEFKKLIETVTPLLKTRHFEKLLKRIDRTYLLMWGVMILTVPFISQNINAIFPWFVEYGSIYGLQKMSDRYKKRTELDGKDKIIIDLEAWAHAFMIDQADDYDWESFLDEITADRLGLMDRYLAMVDYLKELEEEKEELRTKEAEKKQAEKEAEIRRQAIEHKAQEIQRQRRLRD